MSPDFWKPISLAEFNERTGHAYQPVTACDIALEHWIERSGVMLGVIVVNRPDHDYGFAILGSDQHGQFRAIVTAYERTINDARKAMQAAMREILATGATTFPQDCLQ